VPNGNPATPNPTSSIVAHLMEANALGQDVFYNISGGETASHVLSAWGAVITHSPLFEIALVLVRLDQVAGRVVNANHGIVRAAVMEGVPSRCARSSYY